MPIASKDNISVAGMQVTCGSKILEGYKAPYTATAIDRLRDAGAEAVIFGCTEIGLLLRPDDVPLRAFDTTALHAGAAVSFSLADGARR